MIISWPTLWTADSLDGRKTPQGSFSSSEASVCTNSDKPTQFPEKNAHQLNHACSATAIAWWRASGGKSARRTDGLFYCGGEAALQARESAREVELGRQQERFLPGPSRQEHGAVETADQVATTRWRVGSGARGGAGDRFMERRPGSDSIWFRGVTICWRLSPPDSPHHHFFGSSSTRTTRLS
jgi:hypothetical protein